MSDTDVRLFTVERANATLPLVSRIVGDLLSLHPRWRQAVVEYESLQMTESAESESDAAREARLEAGRLAGEIESCLEELEQVGCVFKGFDAGLVDFPAMLEDRMVYLCWRHGESRVEYWHELDTGFSGRQPLDPAFTSVSTA